MTSRLLTTIVAVVLTASAPAQSVSIRRTGVKGADVELRFRGVTGESYRVFSAPDVSAVDWTDTEVTGEGGGAELVLVVPQAGTAPRRFFRLGITPSAGSGFVVIPSGTFTMGNQMAAAEGTPAELPAIQVRTGDFWIGKTEVTKDQWDAGYTYALAHGYTFAYSGSGLAGNHPVQTISWYDTLKWCNARSEQDGLEPCYSVSTGLYKTGSPSGIRWDPLKNGYRLPSEAEWEKAARGGLAAQRFPWGDLINHTLANYVANPGLSYDNNPTSGAHPAYVRTTFPYTSPVGSFAPNGYGLYDMAGNVLEWCWDRPSTNYNAGYKINLISASSQFERVLRGGSWLGQAGIARVSRRGSAFPDSGKGSDVGFRIARGRL